jgi:hypothetical protein
MTRLPLVLAIFFIGVGAASTVAAHEADQAQVAAPSVASEDRGDAPVVSGSLRLALAFWLPVYYGMFVWLLTNGDGGGGARRRVRDRGRLVPALASARANCRRANIS